ncbi:SAM-dependent methyltransferase [Campylobacter blaseri]|uniref:Methyltransferase n=1 Tax=Campylobacter blaseri TaxID=2042961 RepID=A0A2P8R2F3_9BACT|nr:class I SAM-dependent methyltransferase [Campylobacter blaseri]PSM52680.1 methyltransferase [Campylobacter blaseri]PSM54328.1 methyltransferase [Campylobacter blaseri]QKF85980.1 SAM-dependent methyltransferase [Campylobacter blaseri]
MIKNKTSEKSYDEIPYPSKSFALTQPDHLNAVLQLFGFFAEKISSARVLEIGCSFGGNIIPFSIANPNSYVVGIDLSGVQIEAGQNIVNFLGLKNLNLYQKNILDYNNEFGFFDYIICHGVFSWVNKEVQNKILEVIKNSLSPNGVACISYNTYPGWKNMDILRDIMTFRADLLKKNGQNIDNSNIVSYGKGAIEFLRNYSYLNETLKDMAKNVLEKSNYYIYHEYYEEVNQPIYLYEFNNMLSKKGLSHICDSEISKTIPLYQHENINMEEALSNECGDDSIAKEQYYDFIYNRQFRTSIITHINNKNNIGISKNFKIKNLENINIKNSRNFDYVYKEIQEYLEKIYPNTITIKELKERFSTNKNIYLEVLDLIHNKQVSIHSEKFILKKEEKPKIKSSWLKYIKYHIKTENPVISFSTKWGANYEFSDLELNTLLLFDGTRTDKDIFDILKTKFNNKEITINKENLTDVQANNELNSFILNLRKIVEIHGFNQ